MTEQSASTSPPLRSHLTTFCSSPRCADRWISLGSGVEELIAARRRSSPLAPRIRVAPPASVQPLVRAAPPLGAAAESRSGKPSRARSLQGGGRVIYNNSHQRNYWVWSSRIKHPLPSAVHNSIVCQLRLLVTNNFLTNFGSSNTVTFGSEVHANFGGEVKGRVLGRKFCKVGISF